MNFQYAEGSYDVLRRSPTFDLKSSDSHGTQCAGEIVAARNSVCGVGVAFDAKISGITSDIESK